jgi:hypothetical protein
MVAASSFVIRDIPHPLSPLLSEKSANAGELRLPGRAGKFGLSGSLAMKAKLAKAKVLKLHFRRRITISCFLFAAQGVRTWVLTGIAELPNRLSDLYFGCYSDVALSSARGCDPFLPLT